jgi:hypothetical protein
MKKYILLSKMKKMFKKVEFRKKEKRILSESTED